MADQKINKLIDKYLAGSLTERECRRLNDWLGTDPGHKHYFLEYVGSEELLSREDLEKSWNELQRKILFRESLGRITADQGVHPHRMNLKRLTAGVLKYAAVMLLGAMGALITWNYILNRETAGDEHWVVAETVAGQKARVVLPDSSVVWLNSETTLSFPPDYLRQRKRRVKLDGEAYFDIADQHRNSLTVVSQDYDIAVKGTKFNVMAYSDFDRTETILVEGSISIRKGSREIAVQPGQRVVWDGNKMIRSAGMIRQATLWKDNKFYFDHISFKELIRRLERWYDVEITVLDQSLNNENYSGYFKNEETIWQVLDVLKMTTPITYERKAFREIVLDRR
jgi:transmembrane sensor